MSEYIQAQIHETETTVEVRWVYGENEYALLMGQEMFDLLDVTSGQATPVLSKVMIGLDHPSLNAGVMLSAEGFQQK